jgi:hypothetical protein
MKFQSLSYLSIGLLITDNRVVSGAVFCVIYMFFMSMRYSAIGPYHTAFELPRPAARRSPARERYLGSRKTRMMTFLLFYLYLLLMHDNAPLQYPI